MLENKQIGFIGGGAIAEALIGGILKAGLIAPAQITVSDISQERLEFLASKFTVATLGESQRIASKVDVLFLTVKPQVIDTVLENIAHSITEKTIVVSVAAGVTLDHLQSSLPVGIQVVRVMPNTPVAVGAGMAAIALGNYADDKTGEMVAAIFQSSGRAVILDEHAMDAVTGLSGSGPAFAFLIIEALSDAGVRVGLTRQNALLLSAQTIFGAAKMVLETGEHPAKLKDMVTSPGGTTIAGVHILEEKNVRAAMIDAVIAATNRSREMGKK